MKKALSVILALVVCLSICACGAKKDTPDYSGVWIRDEYVNPTTGVKSYVTLHLNADGTFKRETTNSAGEYEAYQGSWEVKDGEIVLNFLRLLAGKDPAYDKDGNLIGNSHTQKLAIVDLITLENNGIKYKKDVK